MKKIKFKFLPLAAAVVAFAVFGILQTLKATSTYAETIVNTLLLSSSTSSVTEGELPAFTVNNSTEGTVASAYGDNTEWVYWGSGYSSWHAFGLETPTAVADGTTHYGLLILLEPENNYIFDEEASNYTIYFNGEDYTNIGHSMVSVNANGGSVYAYIDLGTAEEASPQPDAVDYVVHTIVTSFHGTYVVNYETENPTPNLNTELSTSSMFGVSQNTEMTLVANPEEGYMFEGWWTAHEESQDDLTIFATDDLLTENTTLNYTPTDNIYLMPITRKIISVTVDVNGGNAITPNVFEGLEGQSLAEIFSEVDITPTHPNPNKVFAGLCANAACTEEIDLEMPIWNDTEVFINWVDGVPHNLIYNLNYYGDERDIIESVAYEGFPVQFINDPERENFVFTGWFEDPECTQFFDGDNGIFEDKTIYANWGVPVDSIEISVAAPQVGETVELTYNQEWDFWEPNLVPDVTSNSEAYTTDHPDWVVGICPANDWDNHDCDTLFEGTFEPDTDYYARISVFATNGHAFTPETLNNITVNGEAPVGDFGYWGPNDFMIIARVHTANTEAYTLQFDTDGGEPIDPITRDAGVVMQLPIANKSGWTFQEWQKWDEFNHPIAIYTPSDQFEFTENTTLHAIYAEDTGERVITFNNNGGTGSMNSVDVMLNDEFIVPESDFAAPNNMTFGNWYYDTENNRINLWPGERVRVEGNLELVANWIGETELSQFVATVSGPVIGDALSTVNVQSESEIYTAEIVDWCLGDNDQIELCESPLSLSTTFAEGQSYVVKIKFTITDNVHTVAWPSSAKINDRRTHSWNYSGTELMATLVMEPVEGGDEPGPDPTDTPKFYSLDKSATSSIEVSYGTNIANLISEKRDIFEQQAGIHEELNYGPLFESETVPYHYAEMTGETWTMVCVNDQNEIVDDATCNSEGLRHGYTVKIHYTEVTVTKKTTVEVEFDTNGGNLVDNQTINGGTTATDPGAVSKGEDYAFAGWSVDEVVVDVNTGEIAAGKSLFNFDTPINDDITLVANWKNIYTVRFEDNILPDYLKPVDQKVVAGEYPESPKDVDGDSIRTYYDDFTLEGYYKNSSYSTEFSFSEAVVENTTVYLKWHDEYDDYENIESVSIEVAAPTIGTEITMTDQSDLRTQGPQVTVTIPQNAKYGLGDEHYSNWYVDKDFASDYFTGTLVKNNTYYVAVVLSTTGGEVFSRNVNITVNGTAVAPEDIYNDFDYVSFFIEVTPSEVAYEIEGGGQEHSVVDDVDDPMEFRGSGELAKFLKVEVDGTTLVEGESYEKSEGSTIITLLPDYLNTLSAGAHTLKMTWEDGSASTTFTISNPNTAPTDGGDNNPKTADTIVIWNTALFVSSIIFGLSLIGLKKTFKR